MVLSLDTKIRDRIKIFQPEKPSLIASKLFSLQPDFQLVASYAHILKSDILNIPKLGTIGVHPSLLPKYRGTTPIQTALLNGDPKTGTTIYLMDEGMDSGPILASREIPISDADNYETLHDRLAILSAELLIEIIPRFLKGEVEPVLQNQSEATFTKKFKTGDGFIPPASLKAAAEGDMKKGLEIHNLIRALNPEPGAWTTGWQPSEGKLHPADNKRVKLLESKIEEGKLKLIKIQVEGEKPKMANG